jgi:hypothetical protein
VARLDVATEPGRVSLLLDTPLDNLLGFEHAPRNEAERARADAVVARLRAAAALFRIDSAAGCKPAQVDLKAPALGLGAGVAPGEKDAHADLEAQFDFSCQNGARASYIEHDLFEAFPNLKRIELQAATPKGQMKATLKRPQSRVLLVR